MLGRLIELGVGGLALAIAGLTLRVCYDLVAHNPNANPADLTQWAIVYALVFLCLVAVTFGLRLLIPRLRLPGGRIIGKQGLIAFGLLYALLFVLTLWYGRGSVEDKIEAVALRAGLILAIAVALRSTFGPRLGG
jgi:hypothetical protein